MLIVHRAERSDTLADALAAVLAQPLDDPFTAEVVAVPAKGVERWLCQHLATRLGSRDGDGVAANIAFPSTARLVEEAVTAASGIGPDEDPWGSGRLVWTVLDVVDGSLDERWCSVLARHLGSASRDTDNYRRGRRYATAAHLAELFRGYGAQRPTMLAGWACGDDTDGAGAQLPDDLRWQAQLWRLVRARIGTPSPAERLDRTCRTLRDDPGCIELPTRVSLFGATRLTSDQVAVLSALGANRDVHLWIPHPSPEMWRELGAAAAVVRRAADPSALVVRHPLLSSLARDVRELQFRLRTVDATDVVHDGAGFPDTLLGRVQADIAADRAPSLGAVADGTVEIHACHGPSRQVEVLRERLLHLFSDDPTLQPRDVVVMCPDVETYAPLIRAAFGQDIGTHPAHKLRVRLADRALHRINPLLATVATLLELAGGRVTASQVLDLVGSAPVRARFGFDDDDLEVLRDWVAAAGARWALGRRQRAAFGLGEFPQNTFHTALDRILLGAAADESGGWLGLALPLDDVDSADIDRAGRFAEFVDRLAVTLRDLSGPQPAGVWTKVLHRALDLLTDVGPADTWQAEQAHRELVAATEHAGETVLRLPDVRALLRRRLAGRPTRANFRTGELTVCTMVPMRSVPHRVVVLLGVDDDVFPRTPDVDGDDVTARAPCIGERDPRSEDRQLLLDAVMAASERLLVFYSGADPVTGVERPPAVPISEVLDVVWSMVGPAADSTVVTRHPLQPFDRRCFATPTPFSFDRSALAGARAGSAALSPVAPLLPAPLPESAAADVDLADLVAFAVHPTQAFLWQRLRVRVPERDEDVVDALAVDPDPLTTWDIGDRMLAARLGGTEAAAFRAAEWRRGTLPPFGLGERRLTEIDTTVEKLVQTCAPIHRGVPETVEISVNLGGGRRLTGTVGGVHGDVLARTVYSRLGAKHRLTAWIRLLAVAATRPGQLRAVTTGRGQGRRPAWRSTLTAPADAVTVLGDLVDLRDRGLREPLPIFTGASAEYAQRRARGDTIDDALTAARNAWGGKYGDSVDRHVSYVHGAAPFDRFGDEAARPGEADRAGEPGRFGALACRLWVPLLAVETLGQP